MLWTVSIIVFFLLIPLPLRSTRTHTRFPYTTLFRSAVKKRGLGRGLDALLSGPTVSSLEEQAVQADQRELQHLPQTEEHTSELQSLMRNSYAVFCLKKNKKTRAIYCTSPTCTSTNVLLQVSDTPSSINIAYAN